MSEGKRVRYFVTNHQNQPLELYLPGGQIVLGPRADAEIQQSDLAAAQLAVLRRNRVLTTREVEEAVAEPDAADSPEDAGDSKPARSKARKK